jgi:hypothetical protein
MKKFITILLISVVVLAMAATHDDRINPKYPVARYQFTQQTYTAGGSHAATTDTIQRVSGTIYRIDVLVSAVSESPTVAITWADQNGVKIIPDSLLASVSDGTNNIYLAESNKATQDANFNPVPHEGNITITVDPSATDADENMTVDVILYVR